MAAGEKTQLAGCTKRVRRYRNPQAPPPPKNKKADQTEDVGVAVEGEGGEGREGGREGGVTRSSAALWEVGKVGICCCGRGRRRLGLAGVGAPVHFPQLEAPVEPDDGAEGARWQHAPGSAGDLLAGCWTSSLGRGFCQATGLWLPKTGGEGGGGAPLR